MISKKTSLMIITVCILINVVFALTVISPTIAYQRILINE